MGNRAIIQPINSTMGVYLHWNGGLDSVTAFLKYCEMKDYRPFGGKYSDGYGIARFCQVVGNFFGGNLSIGLVNNVTKDDAEGLDNGIYIIDGWKIVKRIGHKTLSEGYDITEMLCDIDDAQPESERLTRGYITAEEVDPAELHIGDKIYCLNTEGQMEIHTVIGFGTFGQRCNGTDVTDVPYVNKYGDKNPEENINNYITENVRVFKEE